MEWDQLNLDIVTSTKVNITNNSLLNGPGQVPAWTTWYSQPPTLTRNTTTNDRLITFGILTPSHQGIRYLRPWGLRKSLMYPVRP
eukprot:3982789-Heterocapsa_arctica.AAC.1